MCFDEYSDAIQEWAQKVLDNRGVNAELSLKYCNQIITYGKEKKDDRLLGFAYFYTGETYYLLNDANNFFSCISKAITHLDRAEEWLLMAKCYNAMGITSTNRGNAPIALDYYLTGINCCRKHGLEKQESVININIGSLNLSCARYGEAQEYFQRSAEYLNSIPEDPEYNGYILCVYGNLIKSLIFQGKYQDARELLDVVYRNHWNEPDLLDEITIWCDEAFYYHRMNMPEDRNFYIRKIQERTTPNMAIMDIFYDYYDYCTMLLETDQDDAFWETIEVLESMIKNIQMINLQLKLISLKLRYYRLHGQSADYLQAAGLYYELTEHQERENQMMISSMLNVRRSLEEANEKRKEMEIQNQKLVEKSELDQLTKMANRYRLNDFSVEAFQRALDQQTSLTVEILDIDYFKEYNDNYGHQRGDTVLSSIGEVIKAMAAEYNGFCARYGGDEFILIYEGATEAQVHEMATELKKRVMDLKIEHKFSKALPFVTVSQGLCWSIPKPENRVWDYLYAADNMLYKVKRFSRNNFYLGNLRGEEFKGTDTD